MERLTGKWSKKNNTDIENKTKTSISPTILNDKINDGSQAVGIEGASHE